MKGIIFNIAENYLSQTYSEELFDDIVSTCDLQTTEPFVGPGTYPDEDFLKIIASAADRLEVAQHNLLVDLGRFSFNGLATKFPNFLDGHDDPKSFLQTVDGIIHVEVRKLYKDTYLPTFQYDDPAPDRLIITYFSERKLYGFMEGLIAGVGDHFDSQITQEITKFERDGLEYCDFNLTFGG